MSLSGVAKETLAILEAGSYKNKNGQMIDLGGAIRHAVEGTVLYRPDWHPPLPASTPASKAPRIEVTSETTGEAARRVVAKEGPSRVAALNFASAKNPGGGFVGGAKAQEEDLARSSALYPCLLKMREYYDQNRATDSMLYTDHLIYSPDVPFFRNDHFDLLPEPFVVSVVTAPAPNAGEHLRRNPTGHAEIRQALRRRAEKVLHVMRNQGRPVAILGAWGCGVFRNDPAEVADAFLSLLEGPFRTSFESVIFPVYDRRKDSKTRAAFEERASAFG